MRGGELFPTAAGEPENVAARFFGGATLHFRHDSTLETKLVGQRFSVSFALFRLFVKQLRRGGWAALQRKTTHDHDPLVRPAPDFKLVAGSNYVAGLGAVAVQINFSALDRFCREASGFEEARCPKPFVEPDLFVSLYLFHLDLDLGTDSFLDRLPVDELSRNDILNGDSC